MLRLSVFPGHQDLVEVASFIAELRDMDLDAANGTANSQHEQQQLVLCGGCGRMFPRRYGECPYCEGDDGSC